MKYILPLFILLILNGCTSTNEDQPKPKQSNDKSTGKTQKTVYKYVKRYTPANQNDEYVHNSLNDTIISIADQLFMTNVSKRNRLRIILTSFVDLNELNKTSSFGRVISESMFNELHIRKFKVTDFRGKKNVTVTSKGEFHITRDAEKLKDTIEAVEYILVGTYAKFENESMLVNARIIDSLSGNVISSSRVLYKPKDCKIFDLCAKANLLNINRNHRKIIPKIMPEEDNTPVMIIEDN